MLTVFMQRSDFQYRGQSTVDGGCVAFYGHHPDHETVVRETTIIHIAMTNEISALQHLSVDDIEIPK